MRKVRQSDCSVKCCQAQQHGLHASQSIKPGAFLGQIFAGRAVPGQVSHASVSGSGWRAVMTQREGADRSYGPPGHGSPRQIPGGQSSGPGKSAAVAVQVAPLALLRGEGVQLLRQGTQLSVPAIQPCSYAFVLMTCFSVVYPTFTTSNTAHIYSGHLLLKGM